MAKSKQNNAATLWKPDQNVDVTLFKAAFTSFAYDRHTHDEYAIGVIDSGVQYFHHKGSSYKATPQSIITVNPDEVHDGESLLADGYRYRMIYVGQPYLHSLFGDDFERKGFHGFKAPIVNDLEVANQLGAAFHVIEAGRANMDEVLSPVLFNLFSRHAAPCPPALDVSDNGQKIRWVMEYLQEHRAHQIALDELAGMTGLSKYHFIRLFKKQTGLTPHVYHLHQRIRLARQVMEQGDSPADAAMKAGFSDQSHLTRRFKAFYGVTPGSFIRSL